MQDFSTGGEVKERLEELRGAVAAGEPEDADFDWTWYAETPEAFYRALLG